MEAIINPGIATVEAVITRADGTVEDLGIIATTHIEQQEE